ncbi:MAG: hypothetical protein WC876_01655, partial [Candidatus Thermoplasmatota archaeon]
KEKVSGKYVPRARRNDLLENGGAAPDTALTIAELAKLCQMNTGDEPRAPLPLPVLLSHRPIFRG